jgi:hypothetical protein
VADLGWPFLGLQVAGRSTAWALATTSMVTPSDHNCATTLTNGSVLTDEPR